MQMINIYIKALFKKLSRFSKHPYFGFVVFGIALVIAQLLSMGGILSQSVMTSFVLTMIYSVVALGFALLLGYAGLASLGTAGFVGLGTYLIGHFSGTLGYPLILTLLISLGGAVLLGVIVGFISLRIEGMYLAIITLGLAEIMKEVFKSFSAFTNGVNGLSFRDFNIFGIAISANAVNFIVIIVFILMIVATLNIIKSPTGRAFLAMKNSDSAAQSMGIALLKYRLIAFIIATLYAVIGGMLYMINQEFSIPQKWSLDFSLNILAAVIVGGAQSVTGIILGTFMIFGLNSAVLQNIDFFVQNPSATWILNGTLIIVVIMFYPGGLIRLLKTIVYKVKGWYLQLRHLWRIYRYGQDSK